MDFGVGEEEDASWNQIKPEAKWGLERLEKSLTRQR